MEEVRWLPLVEYSLNTGISISTIRRRIKKGLISFKEEGGKYYIKSKATLGSKGTEESLATCSQESKNQGKFLEMELEIARLNHEIKILRSEIIEQRMLIDLYEKNDRSINI